MPEGQISDSREKQYFACFWSGGFILQVCNNKAHCWFVQIWVWQTTELASQNSLNVYWCYCLEGGFSHGEGAALCLWPFNYHLAMPRDFDELRMQLPLGVYSLCGAWFIMCTLFLWPQNIRLQYDQSDFAWLQDLIWVPIRATTAELEGYFSLRPINGLCSEAQPDC